MTHRLDSESGTGVRLDKWAFEARAVAALFVLGSGNLILADLAAVLRRELSGLSQASGRLRKRLPEDGRLAGQVEKVSMRLNGTPICQA